MPTGALNEDATLHPRPDAVIPQNLVAGRNQGCLERQPHDRSGPYAGAFAGQIGRRALGLDTRGDRRCGERAVARTGRGECGFRLRIRPGRTGRPGVASRALARLPHLQVHTHLRSWMYRNCRTSLRPQGSFSPPPEGAELSFHVGVSLEDDATEEARTAVNATLAEVSADLKST